MSGPAIGGTLITVLGSNLGPAKALALGRVGDTSAMLAAFPLFEQATLKIPEGVGSSLDISVLIDGNIGLSNKGVKVFSRLCKNVP